MRGVPSFRFRFFQGVDSPQQLGEAFEDGGALEPLPADQARTYLLLANGFSKEMDINSGSPDSVEPLPFHAMSRYPYSLSERYLGTSVYRRYRDTYNTRTVITSVPRIEASR